MKCQSKTHEMDFAACFYLMYRGAEHRHRALAEGELGIAETRWQRRTARLILLN